MKICNEKKDVTTMVNLSKVAEMIQSGSFNNLQNMEGLNNNKEDIFYINLSDSLYSYEDAIRFGFLDDSKVRRIGYKINTLYGREEYLKNFISKNNFVELAYFDNENNLNVFCKIEPSFTFSKQERDNLIYSLQALFFNSMIGYTNLVFDTKQEMLDNEKIPLSYDDKVYFNLFAVEFNVGCKEVKAIYDGFIDRCKKGAYVEGFHHKRAAQYIYSMGLNELIDIPIEYFILFTHKCLNDLIEKDRVSIVKSMEKKRGEEEKQKKGHLMAKIDECFSWDFSNEDKGYLQFSVQNAIIEEKINDMLSNINKMMVYKENINIDDKLRNKLNALANKIKLMVNK